MKTSSYFLVVVSAFLLVALVVQGLVPYQADGIEQKEPKRDVLDRHEIAISQMGKSLKELRAEVRSLRATVKSLNTRLKQVEDTVKYVKANITSLKEKHETKAKRGIR